MPEPKQTATVVCMKWGTRYGSEYPNRLYAAVARNVCRPLHFVCLTDDGRGLHPDIDVRPLPPVPGRATRDSRWHKVALFSEQLADLSGEALFLDLDLVVVGSLERFFDAPGDVIAVRDGDLFPRRLFDVFRGDRVAARGHTANTSVFRFRVGGHPEIVSRYEAEQSSIVDGFRNEQEYVTAQLRETHSLSFWPQGWCVSFKHDCVPRGVSSFYRDPDLPHGASIVVFAGRLKMDAVLAGKASRLHRRIGPVPWLREHWRDPEA